MRTVLAAAFLAVCVAPAVPAAAQDTFVASEEPSARGIYTAWGHDFQLFMGTEGPVNSSTGSRPCAAGVCGWAAGLHLPSKARIDSLEFSACDGDPTQELSFALLRCPKVPGSSIVVAPGFTHTGIGATPGCATFTMTLPTSEIVQNDQYAYVLVVNATAGANVEWNQLRATYRLE